jgi:hypothetical protein
MMFFSIDMCKLLLEIIKLAHAYYLASQVSHVVFLPSQSTLFKILHPISTDYKIFPFLTTHLPKSLLSGSLFGVNVLATRLISP